MTNSAYNQFMQIGDLVVDDTVHNRESPSPIDDWYGIILDFDGDGDPLVQWFEKGSTLGEALHEFKTTVKVVK